MGGSMPWPQVPVANKDYTNAAVVIIGAGVSGLCMAIDLIKRNKCHNFIIIEKGTSVGGTWHDNKYPGCCCDVASVLYSYSFEQNPDWSRAYPGQEEILEYLHNVANKYKLHKYIRFNTSVNSATWNDETSRWSVDVAVEGGKIAEFGPSYKINCDFLISAVGQLNNPRYPDIPGLDEFKGKVMHSARWDWSYELQGKKIGMIGSGATAAQIAPTVLDVAENLTMYQRTPNWVIPRGDEPVSALRQAVRRYLPPVRWRERSLMMDFRESFFEAVTASESAFAGYIRAETKRLLEANFPNQPEIHAKLTPKYNPGCKRVLITDDFLPALANPKTTLETQGIKRITETGIEMQDGTHHEHDLIVLATGFRTVEFLFPMELTGTGNRLLSDIWSDGACALYGTTVPSLPNFATVYGPNTGLGHNSIILMIESQTRYLTTLVDAVLDARTRGAPIGIMPRQDRTDAFNDKMQKILQTTSFGDPNCASWYKNEAGRVTANWSGTVVEFQKVMSRVEWDDFETVGKNGEKGENLSKIVFGKGAKKTELGRIVEESQVSNAAMVLGAVSAALGVAFLLREKLPRRLPFVG